MAEWPPPNDLDKEFTTYERNVVQKHDFTSSILIVINTVPRASSATNGEALFAVM